MSEDIKAGTLRLELDVDYSKALGKVNEFSKRAANEVEQHLQAASKAQKGLNDEQRRVYQQLAQEEQKRNANLELQKQQLRLKAEESQLTLKELENQREQNKLNKIFDSQLEEAIASRKKSILAAQEELNLIQKLNTESNKLAKAFIQKGASSTGIAALAQFEKQVYDLSSKRIQTGSAQIDLEKQRNLNAALREAEKIQAEITALTEKAAKESKNLTRDSIYETLKVQATRPITERFGSNPVKAAQGRRDQALEAEMLSHSKRLVEEGGKYEAVLAQIKAKHQENLNLLRQTGKSQQEINQAEAEHKKHVADLEANFKDLARELQNLSKERQKNIEADFQKAKNEANRFRNFVAKEFYEGILNQLGASLTNLVKSALMAPINAAIGLLQNAVQGVIGQVSASLDAFKKYETLKVTVNIASQGKGDEAFAFLEKAAEKYRYTIETLADSYKGLVASSTSAGNSLNDTNYIYERLVATSRALGLSNEDLKGSVEAVSQIFSKNKIQAEELRGQLGDRFPGAVQIMAQALGVSTQELDKMMKQGELTSDTLFAFAKKLEEQYGVRLPEALKTTNAAQGDLANQIFKLQKDFGEAINPFNQTAMEAASQILSEISRDVFTQLNQQALAFREYLKANPQIVKSISASITKLLNEGLNKVAEKASEFLKYLKDNPNAIQDGVAKAGELVGLFTKLADLGGKFANWVVQAAEKMDQFMKIPGVKEFLFGSPTIDMNKGAFGMNNGIPAAAPTGPTSSDSYVTNTIPGQQYGDARGGGRRHAGVDFDIGPDGKAITFAGGVVSNIGNDPGGYGHYVDVFNSATRMTERIAEMAEVIVEKGQRVAPGQVVGRGESNTGVIHFEVRTDGSATSGAGSGFNGSINPLDYLKNNNLADVNSSGSVTNVKPKQIYGPAPHATGNQSPPASSISNSSSSGFITNASSSKTAAPINIAQNRNVDRYLTRLAFLESTFDTNAYVASTGAAGAFQFTPATTSDALGAGLPNPTKGSLEEQAKAAWLFIKKFHPEAASAIQSGNFNKADQLLRGRWSSLPGGGEEQDASRIAQANTYLTGATTAKVSVNASGIKDEDIKPGASAEEIRNQRVSEFKQYQSEAKKAARTTQDNQVKQARELRDSQMELAKSTASSSEDGAKLLTYLGDFIKIQDSQADASKEAQRAIEDQEESLKLLKETPLKFNENKAERDKAIKAQEKLISTLKNNLSQITKVYENQISALDARFKASLDKEVAKLALEREQLSASVVNERRVILNNLSLETSDANSYDKQRLQVQQAEENRQAENEQKLLPLTQQRDEAQKQLDSLNSAIAQLPKDQQNNAKRNPLFSLIQDKLNLLNEKIDAITSNDFYQRQLNEAKAQNIDKAQAKAQQSNLNQQLNTESQARKEQYQNYLKREGFSDLTISIKVAEFEKSNALKEINREIEELIQNAKDAGSWTQELEDSIRRTGELRISNLNSQFKELTSILNEEKQSQFKEFFSRLDSGGKDFITSMLLGTQTLGDAFKNLFSSILSQLAQLAVNRLWTELFKGQGVGGIFQPKQQSGFGGILGLAGSLIGSFSGGGGLAANAFTGGSNFGIASGFKIPGFATGGIVTSPTLAMIGEGRHNEAVVPMPNGRAIPVDLKGAGGLSSSSIQSSVSMDITVHNNGSSSVDASAAGALGKIAAQAAESALINHLRAGGAINQAIRQSR